MKLRLFVVVMLAAQFASAQTYNEWFRQKKTQIKYLTEQIAALKVYADFVENGYIIAKDGLDIIQAVKQGDFDLHHSYFSSLKKVNHNVKAYAKIPEIIAMQVSIVKACHRQKLNMANSGQFSAGELNYAGKVFDNVLTGCTEIIDQLLAITTDGLLQMKDDERIKNIDKLYDNVQENYAFVRHFGNENSMLAVQRMREQNDVKVSKEFFNVK